MNGSFRSEIPVRFLKYGIDLIKTEAMISSHALLPLCGICSCRLQVNSDPNNNNKPQQTKNGYILSCYDFICIECIYQQVKVEQNTDINRDQCRPSMIKNCPICSKNNIRALSISNLDALPNEVKRLFSDPCKELDSHQSTLKFQLKHYVTTINRMSSLICKLQGDKVKLISMMQDMEQKNATQSSVPRSHQAQGHPTYEGSEARSSRSQSNPLESTTNLANFNSFNSRSRPTSACSPAGRVPSAMDTTTAGLEHYRDAVQSSSNNGYHSSNSSGSVLGKRPGPTAQPSDESTQQSFGSRVGTPNLSERPRTTCSAFSAAGFSDKFATQPATGSRPSSSNSRPFSANIVGASNPARLRSPHIPIVRSPSTVTPSAIGISSSLRPQSSGMQGTRTGFSMMPPVGPAFGSQKSSLQQFMATAAPRN